MDIAFWQSYKVPIVLGIGSIILIVISVVLLVKSTQTTTPIQFSRDNVSIQSSKIANFSDLIKVDVSGAVERPGVYELILGSRIEDAIASAGGLSRELDQESFSKNINQAQKVIDGMKIYIPKRGDDPTSYSVGTSVNTASQGELESLSGIGPVTAQKIISGRPYSALEELVTKKILGQSLFEKLKDKLSL